MLWPGTVQPLRKFGKNASCKSRRVLNQGSTEQIFYSYLDLIRVDTEILRESQEILETIPLSVDQRQKLESSVLSLQGRIQECNKLLVKDELRLEKALEMDKAHGPALEDLTARLERDEQVVGQWIEDKRRQAETSVPGVVNTDAIVSTSSHLRGGRSYIDDKFEELQNRLDDAHQLTTFDNDLFHDMVNAELGRCASRNKAKNVLGATELYSLELLEEEFKSLVEKLDEAERKIQVLEARGEARAEELGKWMEEDARVYLYVPFCFFAYSTSLGRGADAHGHVGSRGAQGANGVDSRRFTSSQNYGYPTTIRRHLAGADD